jgi:hypothetical protein
MFDLNYIIFPLIFLMADWELESEELEQKEKVKSNNDGRKDNKDHLNETETVIKEEKKKEETSKDISKAPQAKKGVLDEAEDFMSGGQDQSEDTYGLRTEKDYIALATVNAEKIKVAQKPSKFTFTYLKNNIDLLADTLEYEKVNDLLTQLKNIFNKKVKAASNQPKKKEKAEAKVTLNQGKGVETLDKMGNFNDRFQDEDVYDEEEEEY